MRVLSRLETIITEELRGPGTMQVVGQSEAPQGFSHTKEIIGSKYTFGKSFQTGKLLLY